jgi:hypothetical protein
VDKPLFPVKNGHGRFAIVTFARMNGRAPDWSPCTIHRIGSRGWDSQSRPFHAIPLDLMFLSLFHCIMDAL